MVGKYFILPDQSIGDMKCTVIEQMLLDEDGLKMY